jgi:agmatine/peptidylarginine deiminase
MISKNKLDFLIITTILITVSFSGAVIAKNNDFNYSNQSLVFSLNAPPEPIRNVAEFERMEGVLVRYPFGISYQIIAEMSEEVIVTTIVEDETEKDYVISQYQNYGVYINNCEFLIAPSNSYWTRDYGPWFIFNGNNELCVIDFLYNRPRPLDNAIPAIYATEQGFPYYYMSLEHAGGNYMTDSQGISVSTNLVWSENTEYSHEEIDEIVYNYLGITNYHVVPDALGQYIKHIDCWAKYLSPDTIMIIEVSPSHLNYDEIEEAVEYFENQTSCYGTPYQVERVYTHLSEPYINCLILNDKVLVPITGSSWDDEAIESYQNAMPGYEVLGFTGSWQSTDALHCRTKGIPDRYMLYIDHTPLFGVQNGNDGVEIEAKIVPYSGEKLINNSTCVYWREDSGEWESVQMTPLGNDSYQAVIFPQEDGATIDYYIKAQDESGRIEYHPFIGEPDAHSFIVEIISTNNPPNKPNTPSGPTSGEVNISYTYSTSTNDSDGDQVFYKWNWGDGTYSDWLGPYESEEIVEANHTWDEEKSYSIRVKAKDIFDEESEWSETLKISIPKSKNQYFKPFRFLENLIEKIFIIYNQFFLFN